MLGEQSPHCVSVLQLPLVGCLSINTLLAAATCELGSHPQIILENGAIVKAWPRTEFSIATPCDGRGEFDGRFCDPGYSNERSGRRRFRGGRLRTSPCDCSVRVGAIALLSAAVLDILGLLPVYELSGTSPRTSKAFFSSSETYWTP